MKILLSTISNYLFGYHYEVLDTILELFAKCDLIEKSTFFDGAPDDAAEKMDFLISKGFIKENPRCFQITLTGRLYYEHGGFRKDILRKIIAYSFGIIGALSGIVSLILQFVQ